MSTPRLPLYTRIWNNIKTGWGWFVNKITPSFMQTKENQNTTTSPPPPTQSPSRSIPNQSSTKPNNDENLRSTSKSASINNPPSFLNAQRQHAQSVANELRKNQYPFERQGNKSQDKKK